MRIPLPKIDEQTRNSFLESLNYLGFVIGDGCITTDPEIISAIVDFPVPKTVRQIFLYCNASLYGTDSVRLMPETEMVNRIPFTKVDFSAGELFGD